MSSSIKKSPAFVNILYDFNVNIFTEPIQFICHLSKINVQHHGDIVYSRLIVFIILNVFCVKIIFYIKLN